MKASFVLGLDVGPPGEPTGFAILERPAMENRHGECEYHLRHVERFPPATSYPSIISTLIQRCSASGVLGSPLIIDQTAVGNVFIKQCRKARSGLKLRPLGVTAGQTVQKGDDGTTMVPKRDLVMALQMVLQTRRLKIAPEIAQAKILAAEMSTFRLRKTPIGESAAIEWRDGQFDDLVLAVALAVWYADRHPPITFAPYAVTGGRSVIDTVPPGVFST